MAKATEENCLFSMKTLWTMLEYIYPPLPAEIKSDRWKVVVFDFFWRLLIVFPMKIIGYFGGTKSQLQVLRFSAKCLQSNRHEGGDEYVKVKDTNFDGIPVRIYEPQKKKCDGAIVYTHGGGFVIGNVKGIWHLICRSICKRSGLVIVSIDYRLAPEHKYPVPILDCERAVVHFLRKAHQDYAVDPNKVVLMGDSAGGNLVAVIAQRLREMDVPQPKLQVMVYPWTQMINFKTQSYQLAEKYKGTAMLNPGSMARFTLHYLVGENIGPYMEDIQNNKHITADILLSLDHLPQTSMSGSKPSRPFFEENKDPKPTSMELHNLLKPYLLDPNVSPLLQQRLEGLPKAMIITVSVDPLRDDGIFYAEKLKQAGVEVLHKHYEDGFHGVFGPQMAVGRQMIKDIVNFIQENLS